LQLFPFEELMEQYSGKDTHYVVGKIKLENLLALKEKLSELPVFLGVI